MKYEEKTKDQLIGELEQLRKRVAEFAQYKNECRQLEKELNKYRAQFEELRESEEENEEKFRVISEHSRLGILIVQDNEKKYINRAFTEITGYSPEDLSNWKPMDIMKMIHPDDLPVIIERVKKKQNQAPGTAAPYQVRLITKKSEQKWAEVFIKNILFEGRPAVIATLVDISERKKAEMQAERQRNQLIQADRLASVGILVAGVAHEINNPNQAIMVSGQLLLEAWQDMKHILEAYYQKNGDFLLGGLEYSEMRDIIPNYFSGILESTGRIDNIVSNLKEFSRQEYNEMHRAVKLNMVVKSALTLLSHMLEKSTKNFSLKLDQDLPVIKGNFQRLEQVVINLIQNACQELPSMGKGIFVSTHYNKEEGSVVLKVRDEGSGIIAENLARIKNPFFTTKRNSGGTGLGLSVSSSIIEDHGGSLDFISEVGKGTTAIVTLPCKG